MNLGLIKRLQQRFGGNWISSEYSVYCKTECNRLLWILGVAGVATSLIGFEGMPKVNYDFWGWFFPGLESRVRIAAAPYTALVMWVLAWVLLPVFVLRLIGAISKIEIDTMGPKEYLVRTVFTVMIAVGMLWLFYFAGSSKDTFLGGPSYVYDMYVKGALGMGLLILCIALGTAVITTNAILLLRHGIVARRNKL